MIEIGGVKPSKIMYGTDAVTAVYRGSKRIWGIGIPYGYKRCEYITGSAEARISFQWPSFNTEFESDMQFVGKRTNRQLLTITNTGSTNGATYFGITADGYYELGSEKVIQVDGTQRNKVLLKKSSLNTLTLTSNDYAITRVDESTPFTNVFYCMFTPLQSGYAHDGIKYYGLKRYEGGFLTLDLIPCIDASGQPCFYDAISCQTFYSATGGLTAGPHDVVHFQQLIKCITAGYTSAGISAKRQSDGSYLLSGTLTTSDGFMNINFEIGKNNCKIYNDHTYLLLLHTIPAVADTSAGTVKLRGRAYWGSSVGTSGMTDNTFRTIGTTESVRADTWARFNYSGGTGKTLNCYAWLSLFDITEMFRDCPELAPMTVNAFKALFPDNYYPYTDEPYDVYI